MATSTITNYPANVTVLHPGQSVSSNSGSVTFPGILTGGSKTVLISVPISYNISLIPHNVSVVPSVMTGSLRGVNGYLRGDLANADLLNVADCNISIVKAGWNFLISITFDNAITGVPNNTPVMYTGTLAFDVPSN